MQRFTSTMSDAGKFEVPLPTGFAFATLGPNSLIDLVDIGGTVLGPDDVIAIEATTLKRVRPLRVTGGQVDGFLELELWEACETPVPKPRNPAVVTFGSLMGAAYARRIRLPFAGRRAGVIHMLGDVGKPYDWVVFGVKFLDTKAVGGAARDDYVLLDSNINETPAQEAVTGSGNVLGLTLYIGGLDGGGGGTNGHQDFDEIEVWGRGNGGANAELDIRAEAYDLCR